MKYLFLLLIALFGCQNLLAQEKMNLPERFNSIVDKLADSIAKERKLNLITLPLTSKTARGVVEHYRELFNDLMIYTGVKEEEEISVAGIELLSKFIPILTNKRTIRNTGEFGGNGSGYLAAKYIYSERVLKQVGQDYYQAHEEARNIKKKTGQNITWIQWRSHFNSNWDAVLGFNLSLGWVSDIVGFNNLNDNAGASHIQYYSIGPLNGETFGLDLKIDEYQFGKPYKVISGSNLAMGLMHKGYDKADIRWSIRLAALVYEARDFLYDHLNFNSNETSRYIVKNNPASNSKTLQENLNETFSYLAKIIKSDPKLFEKLQSDLLDFSTFSKLGINLPLDLSNKFEFTLLLLGSYQKDPKAFEKNFRDVFVGCNSGGEKFLSLLKASIRDVNLQLSGVNFALEKISMYRATRIGILKYIRPVNYILDNTIN